MATQDEFKAEVEAFLERQRMKPAAFGAQALKDPKFVFDIRAGRSPSLKTIDRVRAWMAAYDDAHPGDAPQPQAVEEPETPAPPQAAVPRKRRRWGLPLAVLFLAAAGGGAAYYFRAPLFEQIGLAPAGPSQPTGREDIEEALAMLRQRVAGVEAGLTAFDQRLDGIEQRLAESGPVAGQGGAVPSFSPRIEEMARRIEALETDLSARLDRRITPFSQDISALRADVAAMEGALSEIEDVARKIERASLATAFLRLDAAVRGGQPYAGTLGLFMGRVAATEGIDGPPPEAVEILRRFADSGVATAAQLEAQFAALIPRLLQPTGQDGTWWDRFLARFRGLVTVRRIGPVEGEDPAAIVARAEAALGSGEVEAAVAELQALPEAGRQIARPWIDRADAHARALTALETLTDWVSAVEES